MNIIQQVNRGKIAIDALLNGIKRSSGYKNTSSSSGANVPSDADKRILIIFQQVFGDAIILSGSLNEYIKLYPKSKGYRITLIARPYIISFMNSNLPISQDIHMEAVDFKRLVNDYAYYKEIVSKYRNYAETIIVPGTSLSAEILSCSCNAKRKIGLVRSRSVNRPFVMAVFYRRAYTETVVPKDDDMMLQRHRLLLHYLGLQNYKAKLPELLPKPKIIDEEKYAVFCLGSSSMVKCWPIEQFAKVADYIIDQYGWKIHLCGGAEEKLFGKEFIDRVKMPQMVVDHIGKTSFSDWSAIVQHASLVVGNDSATMHIAAAGRVKSVCIAGVYDKYQFFPYKVDELEEGDFLPRTVLHDMPCEWCRTKGYFAGYKNNKCKKRIKQGSCAICIEEITVDEVISSIKDQIEEQAECICKNE